MILRIGNRENSLSRTHHAFTLMELLLVALIMAVAAALVVPNFAQKSRRLELSSAAENFAYTIRLGQMRAMTKGKVLRLMMDPDGYWLEEDKSPASNNHVDFKRHDYQKVPDRGGRITKIPGDIKFLNVHDPVLLFPDGRISQVNIQVCRLEKCFLISTTQQLGRVHVTESGKKDNAIL